MAERYIDYKNGQNIPGLWDNGQDRFIPDYGYSARIQGINESKQRYHEALQKEYRQGTRIQPEKTLHSRPLTVRPEITTNGFAVEAQADEEFFIQLED
jgi:hypothetical protein